MAALLTVDHRNPIEVTEYVGETGMAWRPRSTLQQAVFATTIRDTFNIIRIVMQRYLLTHAAGSLENGNFVTIWTQQIRFQVLTDPDSDNEDNN